VTSVIGLTLLPRGSVLMVITLQLLPLLSLRPLVPSGSLLRRQLDQVYYHHPSFGRCGPKFRERSMLLPLWHLCCCWLFFRFGGGRPLHNVQSVIFRILPEGLALGFTFSSTRAFLKLLNALLLPRRNCSLKSGLSSWSVSCLLSRARPLGVPLAGP
jgi:hypothetical protein